MFTKNRGVFLALLLSDFAVPARAEMNPLGSATATYADPSIWKNGVVDNVVTGAILSADTTLTVSGDLSMPNGFQVGPGLNKKLTFTTDGTRRTISLGGPMTLIPNANENLIFGGGAKISTQQVDFVTSAGVPLVVANSQFRSVIMNGATWRGDGIFVTGAGAGNTWFKGLQALDARGDVVDAEGAVVNVETWNYSGDVPAGLSKGLNNVSALRLGKYGSYQSTVATSLPTLPVSLGALAKLYVSSTHTLGSFTPHAPAHVIGTVSAASVNPVSGASALIVRPGKFTLRDTSNVRLIGGTDTLAAPGSQIPVAPLFFLGKDSNSLQEYYSWAFCLCTYDAVSGVQAIPLSSMKQGFSGAGALDNVFASNVTMTADATVNAVSVYGTLDLGGKTLRVKSGCVRSACDSAPDSVNGFGWEIKNGRLEIDEPFVFADTVHNATARLNVDLATPGNADMRKVMLTIIGDQALNILGTSYFTNFVGTVYSPLGGQVLSTSHINDKVFLDTVQSSLACNGHNDHPVIGGIGGTMKIDPSVKMNGSLFIGTPTTAQYAWHTGGQTNGYVQVGQGGVLAPGALAPDGFRKGSITMDYKNQGSYFSKGMDFLDGSTLEVVVRADGSATSVRLDNGVRATIATNTSLVVSSPDLPRKLNGIEWTVLSSTNSITGAFTTVTDGYRAQTKMLADGKTYAVVLVKKTTGFQLIIR
jgi:hypothetical protein